MAYINFKEEKDAVLNQLSNRIENNKKIYEKAKKDKSFINISSEKKFSYKVTKDRTINNSKIESEEEFLEICDENIVCAVFENCKFYNIKFTNCSFIGCNFINCDFGGGGVIFDNCNFFLQTVNRTPSLNIKDNFSTIFKECKLYVKFINSTMYYIVFDSCQINNSSFELNDMISSILINSKVNTLTISDCDLSGAKFMNNYLEEFEFCDKYKTTMDEKTFMDKITPVKKTKQEYIGIYMIYQSIANEFDKNNLKNNFGEFYYLGRNAERKGLSKIYPKIESFVYWISCGYGERTVNALVFSVFIILFFAALFMIFGITVDDKLISYIYGTNVPQNFREFITLMNDSLNLSVGLFVGGIDNIKIPPVCYMFSNIEMLLGTVMIGVATGTLIRKLVR